MNPLLKNIAGITRLNKPVGILLLAWPVAWALWLATEGQLNGGLVALFATGVVLMRSAGCVINDIMDRGFDARVKRTATRPLAQGSMTLTQAWLTFAGLMLLSASLLVFLNPGSRFLALAAAGMTLLYPLCKRFTHAPQLFLGLTFNMGVLMVYAQVQGHIPLQSWFLYGAAISWTLAYDTIYALQDANDDRHIGVLSTALLFGSYNTLFISGFYLLTLVLFYQATHTNLMFFAAALLMLLAVKQSIQQQYGRAFHTNILIGATLFISLLGGVA